jgi:hypothetical protein
LNPLPQGFGRFSAKKALKGWFLAVLMVLLAESHWQNLSADWGKNGWIGAAKLPQAFLIMASK